MLVTVLLVLLTSSCFAAEHNYVDVLAKSILFYEANWCGPDAGNNRLQWRGPCHTRDGEDVGLDLTGGFHDAGDHVKFGLPQCYTGSVLNYTMYLYEDILKETEQYDYLYNICKHFTDYFIKCNPDENTFYYQIGDGDVDHAYWGPPELQSVIRPTYAAATPSTPASEMCGDAAAALALMYLNSRDTDPEYAEICLTHAKTIYQLGKNYQGRGIGQSYYISGPFWDELCWGAIWLYQATGDNQYLADVDTFIKSHLGEHGALNYQNRWTMCWDDIWAAVFLEMYRITCDQVYRDCVEFNLEYWMNDLQRTPGGLCYLDSWGVLRYTAAECMLALIYYDMSGDVRYRDFARSQIDYMLGSNPRNSSYVVGYGNNYPLFPHHRASSGRLEGPPADEKKTMPQRHILYGALVGGPMMDDSYEDNIDEYRYTEVAIDYNAGFVGAMAGMAKHFGTGQKAEPIPAEPETEDIFVEAALLATGGNEIKIKIFLNNLSVHPPRYENQLSYRYFIDLSELYSKGYSVGDVSVRSDYNPNGAVISPLREWDREKHIYYAEVSYEGIELYGTSELQLVFASYNTSALESSNDPSAKGLTAQTGRSKYIPVYRAGKRVYGVEPDGVDPVIIGDLNGDGELNSLDYILMRRYVLDIIDGLPVPGIEAADLNGDGRVDSLDYILMRRYLLDLM